MAGGLHQPESVRGLVEAKAAIGKGLQRALFQKVRDLGEELGSEVRAVPGQLINVDGEIGAVVAQGADADGGVAEEVALADLQEPPEGPQSPQALLHQLARQRVEDHVHALACGGLEDLVGEG